MKSKYFILMAIVVVLMASSIIVQAQSGENAGRRMGFDPQQMVDNLTKELTLSEAQVKTLENIVKETQKKRENLRSQDLEQSERREMMTVLTDDQNKQIMSILDEKQKEKYKEVLAARVKRMQGRSGGGTQSRQ